ncbi:MAG: UDP-N-acetylmuramoyl-tripeptide--D-alanyl-D-alanine ligase [Fluviicola sp.]
MEQHFTSPFYQSEGICIDTRKIFKNCLYVSIKGENFDGNTFAEQALEQGASHVIVDNAKYFQEGGQMTLVEDSIKYLQQLANHHRNQFDIPFIGITGSNGKTTTKELIHTVLSKKYKVLATEGNLNNHIGVPLTLLRLTEDHEIAIIEMGANRLKDIEELCEIAEPNYGIITNVGKAHLQGFGSFEGVLTTKKELYEAVLLKKGTIVVNGDDDILNNVLPEGVNVVKFGTKDQFVNGKLVGLTPFVVMEWSHGDYSSTPITGQMIGGYNFTNYLAAITFGCIFDVQHAYISEAIEEYTPTNNRSQVFKSERNTLILDCYNANPTSMKSALDSFQMMSHANKLFILGDMRELGKESEVEHQKIIELVEKHDLQGYTVGDEFGKVSSEHILEHFSRVEDALEYFKTNTLQGEVVLLKGSRGVQLEKLVEAL